MNGDIKWVRYVSPQEAEAYVAQGWVSDGLGQLPGLHAYFSILLEWPGPGAPPEPPRHQRREDNPERATG